MASDAAEAPDVGEAQDAAEARLCELLLDYAAMVDGGSGFWKEYALNTWKLAAVAWRGRGTPYKEAIEGLSLWYAVVYNGMCDGCGDYRVFHWVYALGKAVATGADPPLPPLDCFMGECAGRMKQEDGAAALPTMKALCWGGGEPPSVVQEGTA
jgi:hypothetical protein